MIAFKIYDLVSRKFHGTFNNKGEADRQLLQLMKQNPTRKFYIKMVTN